MYKSNGGGGVNDRSRRSMSNAVIRCYFGCNLGPQTTFYSKEKINLLALYRYPKFVGPFRKLKLNLHVYLFERLSEYIGVAFDVHG